MNKKYFALVAICVLALTGSALGQELLSNPGFETWTAGAGGPPDSWILGTGLITATQEAVTVYNGTYSCNTTFTSQSNQDFYQEVAVTGGETYNFNFWALDNDTEGRVRVCILWYGPNHTSYVSYYGGYTSDSPSWQQLSSGDQTAPDTAVTARCMLRYYDIATTWDGDATIYIDDASFQESVPAEPDTVSIHDIQYTTTVGSGCYDSPLVGQTVWVKGIVGYVFTGTYPDFYMAEGDGPFEGILVYDTSIMPAIGDEVLLRADVVEYFGMTELQNVADFTILSSGNTPYGPTVVATGDFGGCNFNGEQWEGMHVRVEDAYVLTWPSTYGEYDVCDGSGPAQIDDDHYANPSYPGQGFPFIQGFVEYSYNTFEILPTCVADFGTPFLAVELMSFDAAAGDAQVTLTWRTASEVNAHSFNIYRDEEIIASVAAFGDAHDYIYVDRDVQNGTEYTYQLGDVDLDGHETIHQMVCSVTPNAVPGSYALNQNYPNPFNPSTEISYALPTETHVTLAVYNLLGQEVATLVDQVKEAGQHTISWNATDNASGVYFYRLQTNDFSATKKMVFMK